jgi:hypothetical protein
LQKDGVLYFKCPSGCLYQYAAKKLQPLPAVIGGTMPVAVNSAICIAALYAGVMNDEGGIIDVRYCGSKNFFSSGTQNGIQAYGSMNKQFSFSFKGKTFKACHPYQTGKNAALVLKPCGTCVGTHDLKCAKTVGVTLPRKRKAQGKPTLGTAFSVEADPTLISLKPEQSITWSVNTCVPGRYRLMFRYLHAIHELNFRLFVNQRPTSVSVTYPRVGMWYHWGTATAEVEVRNTNEILYTTIGKVYLDKVHLIVKPLEKDELEPPGQFGGELNRPDTYGSYKPLASPIANPASSTSTNMSSSVSSSELESIANK